MIRILSIALLVFMFLMPVTSFAQTTLRKASPHTPKVAPKPQPKVMVRPYYVTPQQQMLMDFQRQQQRQYLNFQLQMQRQMYDQQLYLQWRRFWYGF